MSRIASYPVRKRRRDMIIEPFVTAMSENFPGQEVETVLDAFRISGCDVYRITVLTGGGRCSAIVSDAWMKASRGRKYWLRVTARHFVRRFKKHFERTGP